MTQRDDGDRTLYASRIGVPASEAAAIIARRRAALEVRAAQMEQSPQRDEVEQEARRLKQRSAQRSFIAWRNTNEGQNATRRFDE